MTMIRTYFALNRLRVLCAALVVLVAAAEVPAWLKFGVLVPLALWGAWKVLVRFGFAVGRRRRDR